MMNTTAQEVFDSFESSFEDKVVLPEALELLCVFSGANGGVSSQKYQIVIELTNDRGSQAMFASLVECMYTPYTIQRVCKMFSKNDDTMRAAISILFLFASLRGRLSSDDETMMNYIFGK